MKSQDLVHAYDSRRTLRSGMGNLKIMKYFSGVIFIGMEGIFILCLYVYLCIAHPICVCVWR